MTNEEAKKKLKAKSECFKREISGINIDCIHQNCDECNLLYEQGNLGEQKEALDIAVKALEQQPCEDAISREETLRIAKSYYHTECVVDEISQLPPVTPKQKTRKSIIDADKLDEIIVDAIDASTNKIECQTLRWVLDKISELSSVTPQEQQPCDTPRNNLANTSQDCISRAEVLECAYLLTDDEGITHEVVHADDIRYAAPVTWSGWTPATQPPEPNTAVLLYVRYKSSRQHTYQLGMWNANKQAWEDWRTPYQLEEEFEIIKWMELPEGYEEEQA